MDNQIKYTVSLQDLVSPKLDGMNSKAKTFEGTLNGMKGTLGALGISFGILKIEQFIEGGIKKALEFNKTVAQVEAGIKSTGGIAGISAKEIEDLTGSIGKQSLYSKTQMMDSAAQLLTFTNVHKDKYKEILQASADVAARTGGDIHQVSIQMGKAFDNPMKGIMSLRRIGVTFSNEQIEQVKKLQAAGKIQEAQQLMAIELNNQYGGSAKAAFDADPLAVMNKMLGSFQKSLGEVGLTLLSGFIPYINAIGDGFTYIKTTLEPVLGLFSQTSQTTVFLGDAMKQILPLITLATIAWGVYAGVLAIIAVLDPFHWIVIGITLLIAGVISAYKHFEKFRAVIWAVGAVIKEYIKLWTEMFIGFKDIVVGTLTLDLDQIKRGFDKVSDVYKNGAGKIANAAKEGFNAGKKDFNDELFHDWATKKLDTLNNKAFASAKEYNKAVSEFKATLDKNVASGFISGANEKHILGKLKGFKPVSNATGVNTVAVKTPSGAKGQNITTINIHIDSLVKSFSVNTTNLNESSDLIQEKVAMALTAAVNDSQIIK